MAINFMKMIAPLSRLLAKHFFKEKHGRTLSQKVEDELGVSKTIFHAVLFGGALIACLVIFLLIAAIIILELLVEINYPILDFSLMLFLSFIITRLAWSIKKSVRRL